MHTAPNIKNSYNNASQTQNSNFKILKIHEFFSNFKIPTNLKNKIRSADIIYEIYPASI